MSDILNDLRKARLAAIQNRRALACRLSGPWIGDETHETLQRLTQTQRALEAIEAAIIYDEEIEEAEKQKRERVVTIIDLDDGYEEIK